MKSMEKGNTRIHTKDQSRQRRSEQFTGTEEGSERVHRKTGLEVVRPSINPFFILKLASSFMVEIYTMVWAIFFFADSRCFRLQAMAIPLQATGGVHRTPNPHAMSRSRTRDFSRAVFHSLSCQRLSHAQHVHVAQGPHGSSQNGVLSSQKHLPSHSAQHGTQYTFSDDSAITEHSLTSHLHSDPPFDETSNGTSADFIFWRDLPLRRSNKCVFRFLGRSALAYKWWTQRSCRRGQSCAS